MTCICTPATLQGGFSMRRARRKCHGARPKKLTPAAGLCYQGRTFSMAIRAAGLLLTAGFLGIPRSEEHTSELQSQSKIVCRLLLEKKKKKTCLNSLIIEDTKLLEHHHTIDKVTKAEPHERSIHTEHMTTEDSLYLSHLHTTSSYSD